MTYAEAIRDILKNSVPETTQLLEAFMADPHHTLSVYEITHLLKYPHFIGANHIMGRFGRQVYERTGQPHPDEYPPGKFQFQSFIAIKGESRDSSYAHQLRPHIVQALHRLNIGVASSPVYMSGKLLQESKEVFQEGASISVLVNVYERSPQARLSCLAHYGYDCACCGLNVKNYYDLVEDFVHIHHLRPLATIGQAYKVDPIVDLCPVCPNCNAAIHLSSPALSIEELRVKMNN